MRIVYKGKSSHPNPRVNLASYWAQINQTHLFKKIIKCTKQRGKIKLRPPPVRFLYLKHCPGLYLVDSSVSEQDSDRNLEFRHDF